MLATMPKPPHPDGDDALLVTIRPAAEITIKARGTRAAFLKHLRWNVKDALQRAGYDATVWSRGMRVMARMRAEADAAPEPAADALARVFGVGSFSFVEGRSAPELDAIVAEGARLFADHVRGKRFAVRCKRSGTHPFRSVDVERELGAALVEFGTVDLTEPEVTVEVALDGRGALFFRERQPGPGGLPLGTGGRALALVSGGYDSVVAAWSLMRRGVAVDFVHFRLGEAPSERVALRVARVLSERWSAGSRPDIHVIDLRPAVDEMRRVVTPTYWQVALKRLMLRAGDGVADGIEAYGRAMARSSAARRRAVIAIDALVTGDAIGQVSSQTLTNLRAIDAAAGRPVLRPLVGYDKLDIIALARHVGTAELSAAASEECDISPVRPATASRDERLASEEAAMVPDVLARCIAGVAHGETRMPLRVLREGEGWLDGAGEGAGVGAGGTAGDAAAGCADAPAALSSADHAIDHVPAGAVLVDCRPDGQRSPWDPTGYQVVAAPANVADRARFVPGVPYLCFCLHGTRSRWVAGQLRVAGAEAFSFRGGMAALARRLEAAADLGTETATEPAAEPAAEHTAEPTSEPTGLPDTPTVP